MPVVPSRTTTVRGAPKVGGEVVPSKLITVRTRPSVPSARNQLNASADASGANCGVTAY